MFVGFEVKSNQNNAKPTAITNSIRLSQAVLDPSSKGNKKDPVSLVAEYNKKQFILAVLDPNLSWQSPLDLMFEAGSQVKFFLKGTGTVHLTGYETFDDLDDLSLSVSDDEELDVTDFDDEGPARKRVKESSSATKKNSKDVKEAKGTPKRNGVVGPNKKNTKNTPAANNANGEEDSDDENDSDDEDESDDEDFAADLDDEDDDEIDDEGMDDLDDDDLDDDDDSDDESEEE